MKKYISKTLTPILLILLIVSFSDVIYAQTGISFSWYLIRDDNAFKSRSEYEELINTVSLILSRTHSSETMALQAFYGADISTFNKYTDQRNHTHQFGVLSRFLSGNFNTDIAFYAQLRRNDAEYIYYNTDMYSFYIKVQYEPDINVIYSFGLNFLKNKFNEFSDLDNTAYRFYGKFQRFFQSRLSVSGELGLGVKNYVNQSVYSFFGTSGGFLRFPRYTEEPLNAMQLSADINIGKSITDRTGINMGFGGTRYIGDPIEAYLEGIYYYTENDLYDDPYSYKNKYVSAYLTRQFAVGFQGKIGTVYKDKDYSGTPALTDTGELMNENRADARIEYLFLLSKKFNLQWHIPFALDVNFRFLVRQNSSNDPYFDFTDHLGVFGVTFSK